MIELNDRRCHTVATLGDGRFWTLADQRHSIVSCKDEQIIEIDDTGPVVIEVALRERSAAASIVLGEDERVVKVRRAVAVRIAGHLRKLNTKSANGLFQ